MMMMLFLQSEDAVFAIGTPGPSVTGMRAHTCTDKHRRRRSTAGMRAHVSQVSPSSSSARSSAARNC